MIRSISPGNIPGKFFFFQPRNEKFLVESKDFGDMATIKKETECLAKHDDRYACPICYEWHDETSVQLKFCLHFLCRSCFKSIQKEAMRAYKAMECPLCRHQNVRKCFYGFATHMSYNAFPKHRALLIDALKVRGQSIVPVIRSLRAH